MANGRSISDEIIDRLTQSLERDEMQRLSDRLKAQTTASRLSREK
jgi:hypothetical protein